MNITQREIILTILSVIVGAIIATAACVKHYNGVVDNVKGALSVAAQKAHALCADGTYFGPVRVLHLQCGAATELCMCGDPIEVMGDVGLPDFNIEPVEEKK